MLIGRVAAAALAASLVVAMAAPAYAVPGQGQGKGKPAGVGRGNSQKTKVQKGQGSSAKGQSGQGSSVKSQKGPGAPVGRDHGFKTAAGTIGARIARLEAIASQVASRGTDVSTVTTLLDSAKTKLAMALSDEAAAFQASSAARALPQGPGRRAAIKSAQALWKAALSDLKAARADVVAAIHTLQPLVKASRPSDDGTGTVSPTPGGGTGTPSGDASGTPAGGGQPTSTPDATGSPAVAAGTVGPMQVFFLNALTYVRGLLGIR